MGVHGRPRPQHRHSAPAPASATRQGTPTVATFTHGRWLNAGRNERRGVGVAAPYTRGRAIPTASTQEHQGGIVRHEGTPKVATALSTLRPGKTAALGGQSGRQQTPRASVLVVTKPTQPTRTGTPGGFGRGRSGIVTVRRQNTRSNLYVSVRQGWCASSQVTVAQPLGTVATPQRPNACTLAEARTPRHAVTDTPGNTDTQGTRTALAPAHHNSAHTSANPSA
jgi:hypothetical protein